MPSQFDQKNPQQLFDFIVQKGNEAKAQKIEMTKFQTADYEKTQETLDNLNDRLRVFQEKRSAAGDHVNVLRDRIESHTKEIEDKQKQIRAKESEKSSKQKEADALKDKPTPYVQTISKKQIEGINKLLEKESPDVIIKFMEKFVGMLRNSASATNIDVELYFKDAQKLCLKLEKIDATVLNYNIIEKHKKDLANMRRDIQNVPKFDTMWQNLYEWSVAFSEFAFATLRVVQVQNEIDALEAEVHRLTIEKHRDQEVQKVMKENNVVEYYNEAIEKLQERVNVFKEIVDNDHNQAKQYQGDLAAFDKKFFQNEMKTAKADKNFDKKASRRFSAV